MTLFSGKKQITINSDVIYTGEGMTLTFDPTDFNLGNDVKVEWKFNGVVISSERYIISSKSPFTLKIEEVIRDDAGKL